MPTYEFRCPDGHEFEKFYRSISGAESEAVCPVCGKVAERFMSPAGFAFKGSGFYLTDYGKNAHRGEAPPGANAGQSSGDSSGKESPSESPKSESAPSESKSEAPKTDGAKSAETSSAAGNAKQAEKKAEPKAEAKPAPAPPKPGKNE